MQHFFLILVNLYFLIGNLSKILQNTASLFNIICAVLGTIAIILCLIYKGDDEDEIEGD